MDCPAGGLLSILAEIPDPRGCQGRRHPLAAMLAAIVCGILSGATGCTAIAQWIRDQEPSFWHELGFIRRPPTTNCYRDLLLTLPVDVLEKAIRKWVAGIVDAQGITDEQSDSLRAVAIDGKTLCGTLQPHGKSIHLLGLLDHATGCVLAQSDTGSSNEHKAALKLLRSMVLKGQLITGDAMFCQRDLCRQITDSGGDYLFLVKDNQPSLSRTIESDFNLGLSPLQRTHSARTA